MSVLLLWTMNSMAQQTMTLDECLALALTQSRLMQRSDLSVREAKANQGTAWEMDKMEVTLSQDPTSGGSPDNAVSVGQTFSFPTLYAARRRELKAETELARRQQEVTRREVMAQVSGIYYDLALALGSLHVYERQDSVYEVFERLAETKYKNGETSRLEVINAHQTRSENRMLMQGLRQQYETLQQQLADAIGGEERVIVEPVENHHLAIPDFGLDQDAATYDYANTPQGRVMEQEVEVNRRQLSVARNELAPDITLAARTQCVISGFNPYDELRQRYEGGNFMGFEVGMALPLFFGSQRAKVKSQRLALERTALDLEQAQAEARTDYRDAISECRRTASALSYYEKEGHEDAEELARLSQLSYEQGEIGYVEYIQNQKAALELHLNHLKAINDYQHALVRYAKVKE